MVNIYGNFKIIKNVCRFEFTPQLNHIKYVNMDLAFYKKILNMITESKAKTARQINIKTQLHMLQITTTTPSVGNIETNNYMTDTTSHR